MTWKRRRREGSSFFKSRRRLLLVLFLSSSLLFLSVHLFTRISRLPPLLDSLPISCSSLFDGDNEAVEAATNFTFNHSNIYNHILRSHGRRCQLYRELFHFPSQPRSDEEASFPLAYGVLAHDRFIQLMLMLSSFYEPQNLFCLAVPLSSSSEFLRLVHELPDCFSNVHVLQVARISWGSHEIIRATVECMRLLDQQSHPWKYFQYLSGVDVPLRTNLEMVRIFKQFHGAPNVHLERFQNGRLNGKRNKTPPVPLFKTSLSACISREDSHSIVTKPRSKAVLKFLEGTSIADESFWGSVLGHSSIVPSTRINATEYIQYRRQYFALHNLSTDGGKRRLVKETEERCPHHPCINRGFIARFQIWSKHLCGGYLTHSSCVFGLRDLPLLSRQPHLVAHKMYLDYQPAGFLCLLKSLATRRLSPDPSFDSSQYGLLPLVQLHGGSSLSSLSHPEWL